MQVLEFVSPPAEQDAASTITLSPSQRTAANGVCLGLKRGDCAVLGYVQEQLGGSRIGVREFLSTLASYEPMAIEEAFLDLVDAEIAKPQELIIVDDLQLIRNVVESCDYVRRNLLDATLTAVLTSASAARKKLLFAADEMPDPLASRAHSWLIEDFTAGDFETICSAASRPV